MDAEKMEEMRALSQSLANRLWTDGVEYINNVYLYNIMAVQNP